MADQPAAKKTATADKAAPKSTPETYDIHPSMAHALAAFQGEMPTVPKAKEAKVEKDGRLLYSYHYADLADVAQAAFPVMARHGLSHTTRSVFRDGALILEGVLRHTSGEEDVAVLPIQGRDAQAIGSSLTYARRYLLGCQTGIVTDEDDDGQRASGAQAHRQEPRQQSQGRAQSAQQGQGGAEPPAYVQAVYNALNVMDDGVKGELASWWDQWASQGGLPPRQNMAALTEAQAGMVLGKCKELAEREPEDPS